MATKIQVRRDTTANWTTYATTVPAAGEFCYDTDLKTLKIGDGVTQYQNIKVHADGDVDVNALKADIATNAAGIAQNVTDITTNATNIATNVSDIDELESKVEALENADAADLQAVTEAGNNTTNNITLDTDKIVLNADGNARFAGNIICIGDLNGDNLYSNAGYFGDSQQLYINRSGIIGSALGDYSDNGITIELGDGGSLDRPNFKINYDSETVIYLAGDGSAEFKSDISNVELNNNYGIQLYKKTANTNEYGFALFSDVGGVGQPQVLFTADGSATFAGEVTADGFKYLNNNNGGKANVIAIYNATDGTETFPTFQVDSNGTTRIGQYLTEDPKIQLNSNDGSADFAGGNTKILSEGNVQIYRSNPTEAAIITEWFSDVGSEKDSKITFKANGSAEFANIVNAHGAKFLIAAGGSADKPPGTAPEIVTYSPHQVNIGQGAKWYNWASGYKESSESAEVMTASIAWDGSATFDGTVDVGSPNSATETGCRVSSGGQLVVNGETDSNKVFISKVKNQEKITFTGEGSATFLGKVTARNSVSSNGVVFEANFNNDARTHILANGSFKIGGDLSL